jgi:hypothetical protein
MLVDQQKLEWHLIVYVPIKRWPTGERAEMDKDELWLELIEDVKKEMLLSGFQKAIHPKPSDLGLWKKGKYTSNAASLILFINV